MISVIVSAGQWLLVGNWKWALPAAIAALPVIFAGVQSLRLANCKAEFAADKAAQAKAVLGAQEAARKLSDQLGRFWSFLQEELRVARSGETYSAEVPIGGGKAKPARIFRVGHLALGYVTEDGEQSGLWDGAQWVAARSPEEEHALRDAVETLDRRRAPTLLPIPLLRKAAP